jgi:XXXCH domain-containing protein
MKFEEKKRMEKMEIADLFRGLAELIEEGELKLANNVIPFPDSAEVEVVYKEKKDRAKFEVEVKWQPQAIKNRKYSNKTPSPGKTQGSIPEVKQSLKDVFNSLRSTIENGETPSMALVEEYEAINNIFKDLAEGEGYEKEIEEFTSLVEDFAVAVKAQSAAEARALIEKMRASKKSCHKTFRWKE